MRRRRFFDALRALLPRTGAFDLTPQKYLRLFFEAQAVLGDDVRDKLEGVYLDLFPETTRALDKWTETFRVQFSTTLFSAYEKRSALGAMWWLRYGNTTAQFMQKVLGLFLPGVQVTDNVPVANVIGLVYAYKSVCGNKYIRCGNRKAVCNYHVGDRAWIPTILRNDTMQPWDIPTDSRYWETCFFVSRDVFREDNGKFIALQRLKAHEKWQKFIEYIILASKPVHMTAVLFLMYEPDDEEIIYEE